MYLYVCFTGGLFAEKKDGKNETENKIRLLCNRKMFL